MPPADPAIAAVIQNNQQITWPPQLPPPPPPPPPPEGLPLQNLPNPPETLLKTPASSATEATVPNGPSSILSSATEWLCRCGFRNRASNSNCGGTGHLGCSLPKHVGQVSGDERTEGDHRIFVGRFFFWFANLELKSPVVYHYT